MENDPFSSMIGDDLPQKNMVTFHSSVKLPEGTDDAWRFHLQS